MQMEAEKEEEGSAEEAAGEEGEEDEDGLGGAAVHSYKKSQFWSKEVEEKLGSAALTLRLLELEDRRWKASRRRYGRRTDDWCHAAP